MITIQNHDILKPKMKLKLKFGLKASNTIELLTISFCFWPTFVFIYNIIYLGFSIVQRKSNCTIPDGKHSIILKQ